MSASSALVIPAALTAVLEQLSAHVEANTLLVFEQKKSIEALQEKMADKISARASMSQPVDKYSKKSAPARYRECEPCEEEEYNEDDTYVSELTLKPLHSDTAKALRASGGSLSLDQNEKFIERFKNRVEVQHRIFRVLLSLENEEWSELSTASPILEFRGYIVADYLVANRWIADAFLNCLNYAEARVSNFENSLSKDEMSDGRAILAKAARLGDSSVGSQRIDAEQAFHKCFPFVLGADSDQTKQAANEILAKFKRTALYQASKVDPIAIRRMFLGKVPRTVKRLEDKVERWESDLLEAEIKHRNDPDRLLEEPFTKEQLIEYIALALKKEAPANANLAGERKEDGRKRGGGAREGAKICLNCGAVEHETKVCTKACNGLKGCACSAGGKCHLKQKDKPLKHADCKNAAGKKLPKFLFDGLRNKHKEKFPLLYANANAAAGDEEEEEEERATEVKQPKSILKPNASAAMLTSAVHGGSVMLHASASRYSPLAVDNEDEDEPYVWSPNPNEMQSILQGENPSPPPPRRVLRHPMPTRVSRPRMPPPPPSQVHWTECSGPLAMDPYSVYCRSLRASSSNEPPQAPAAQAPAGRGTPRPASPSPPSPPPRGKSMAKARGKPMHSPLPGGRTPQRPPKRSSTPSGFKILREPCMLDSDADLDDELEFIANTGKNSERAVRAMQRKDRAAKNGERTPNASYAAHQRNVARRQRTAAATEASHARAFAERHDASHAQVSERMSQIVERLE